MLFGTNMVRTEHKVESQLYEKYKEFVLKHPVYLWTLPMFHCNGWCFPWTIAATAGVNVCLRKVDPGKIFELIPRHGVTHMGGAPIVYNTLINAPDATKKSAARPVVGLIAGAAPPVAVLEGAERIGIRLHAVSRPNGGL